MSQPPLPALRIGLAGLGTVGLGVVKIVQRHADLIAARSGRPVQITAVSARDRSKPRDADLSAYAWESDTVALARRDDVDVFIEVMGGADGPGADLALPRRRALPGMPPSGVCGRGVWVAWRARREEFGAGRLGRCPMGPRGLTGEVFSMVSFGCAFTGDNFGELSWRW